MNYIGIDIGGTNLKAGLVDEDGRLLAVKTMKIREVSDPDALTDTLVALTRELAQEGGVPMEEIASVGAGVPGVVDIRTGSIVYTCNLPLRNIPLRKLFKRRLGLHLYVENDANCAALAEYYAGAGQGSKRFVTITLGTGIGAGIIHNGKIFHGGNGMAGEVGHTCIDYQGLPCPCGRRGCWEAYSSATALIRQARQAAAELDISLREGVYMYFPGPQYETPAEVRAARLLVADAVGMSTVPEAIVAAHCGMEVLGFTLLSNMAAGILDQPLSEQEVLDAAEAARETFSALVLGCLERL